MSGDTETEKVFAGISAIVDGEELSEVVALGRTELEAHPDWNELLNEHRNTAQIITKFLSVDSHEASAYVAGEIEAMVNGDPNLILIGKYIDGEVTEDEQKKVEELLDEDQSYQDAYTEQRRAQNAIEELLNVDGSDITANVKSEIEDLAPELDEKVVRLERKRFGNFIQRVLPLAAVFALGAVISPAILKEYGTFNQTGSIVLRGASGGERSQEIVALLILEGNQRVGADKLVSPETPFAIQLYSEMDGEAFLYLNTSENEYPDEIQRGAERKLGSVTKGQIINFPKKRAITVDQTDKQLRVDFIIESSKTRREYTYYYEVK